MDLNKYIKKFEHFIIISLVLLIGLVVLFSTIELMFYIIKELWYSMTKPQMLLEKYELMKLFGLIFNVLIGLELFETVRLYLKDDILHAEYILLVGLTAVTRKIIILDYKEYSPQYIIMIAALIAALAGGYFLIRKTQTWGKKEEE